MKTILYLGTDPTHFESQGHVTGHLIHYPVIKIIARSLEDPQIRRAYADLNAYSHLIFTSKNAVKIFFQQLSDLKHSMDVLQSKIVIAIGKVTAAYLTRMGLSPHFTAQKETQEGVVQLLTTIDLNGAYIFLPRSSLSRPILADFFRESQIQYFACDLYETVTQILDPKPDLDQIDEIVFTSPSTVKAFLEIFEDLPKNKRLIAIGPITEQEILRERPQTQLLVSL